MGWLQILRNAARAAALTGGLSHQIFGVTPANPATMASVSLLLTACALLACALPARRASQVDPVIALSCE